MKKHKIMKEASILLIAALLVFSSSVAIANTENTPEALSSPVTKVSASPQPLDQPVVWDNGLALAGLVSAQEEDVYDLDTVPADDFMFDEETDVYGLFFIGGYWNPQGDGKFDWNISFYNDDGTTWFPGTVIFNEVFANADIEQEFYFNSTSSTYINHTIQLDDPITFSANTKYWVSIQGVGDFPPQSGLGRHNESFGGIKLKEGVWKGKYFGVLDWVNSSDQFGEPTDYCFQLLGKETQPAFDITIKGGIGVTATIDNIGDADATNVNATIDVTGGIIIIGGTKTVNIASIPFGTSENAKSFVLGFGSVTIDVAVSCDEGINGAANATKLVLLFLVL
jgi:hypothetical protein